MYDLAAKAARCPQGQISKRWTSTHDQDRNAVIQIQFERDRCSTCTERASCTRAASGPRVLKLRPQAQYEALQAARARQETEEFKQSERLRAGIESTISQGTHGFDLRYARYRAWRKQRCNMCWLPWRSTCPLVCLRGRWFAPLVFAGLVLLILLALQ